MENRKEQFLKTVQILASNDNLILEAAQRVNQEALPSAPGGALQFVVAMQQMKSPHWSCKFRFKSFCGGFNKSKSPPPHEEIGLDDGIRIKNVEFWLKLGQPDEALRELKDLPKQTPETSLCH